jgi:hypothetical protein
VRRLALIRFVAVAILAGGLFCAQAQASTYSSTAAFLDAEVLATHHTAITGEMIVNDWRWYGIDVLPLLVILGAESSLGDPALGGGSVPAYNYGNLKDGHPGAKWEALANGTWYCPGQGTYLTFPSPEIGVMAEGRYLKVGPSFDPGLYRRLFDQTPIDWAAFARVYYGVNVPGLEAYTANLYALDARFRLRAASFGFAW